VDVIPAELTADEDEGVIGEVFGVVTAAWAGDHGSSPSRMVPVQRPWSSINQGHGPTYGRRSRSSRVVRPPGGMPVRRRRACRGRPGALDDPVPAGAAGRRARVGRDRSETAMGTTGPDHASYSP